MGVRFPGPRRVFISHTAELRRLPQGRSFVAAIESAITRAGDVVVDMAYFPAHPLPPADFDRETVESVDVYVLLAGFCYGSPVRDRPDVSYTEQEFEIASEIGIPRLIFLLSEQAEGPSGLFRDPDNSARQEIFRRRLRDSGLVVTEVVSPDHAEALVLAALQQLTRSGADQVSGVRVWGIPGRPARFTGRDDKLAGLRTALSVRPNSVQAIHGMGGVGKTTLVMEYAHRHVRDYDIAWWIRAERSDLIPERLAALARAMRVSGADDGADSAVARLLGDLSRRDRWLVVFDNAEGPSALLPFLPAGNGHVIITSRNPHWDSVAQPMEIREFTRDESVQLVRSRLRSAKVTDAARLADAVGDLPLAVDQAAAHILDTGWSITHYVDQLRDSAQTLLDRKDESDGYPLSVAASWSIAFEQLDLTDPAALQLVTFAAWLAPEPIPLTVLTDNVGALPDLIATALSTPRSWTQTLSLLRRRAIVVVSRESLLLHRIPATLLRANSPAPPPLDGWAATVVRFLREVAPADPWHQPATWPLWQALLPHVLTAADNGRAIAAIAEDIEGLLDGVAGYLQARGELQAARPHFERVYERRRSRFGDDHPDTLTSANNLALDLHALGEYRRACDLDADVFERRSRILGGDHPDTMASANNLARDLRELGEVQSACELDQETFHRKRVKLGEDHPSTLISANELARDLHALGELARARALDEDILSRRRRILGDDHPSTLVSANNLADDLNALGELASARALDEDIFDRRRRILGEDHPTTLVSASNLADDLRKLGDTLGARELDEDTLRRRRRVLGVDHPETLRSAANLARDVRKLGNAAQVSTNDVVRRAVSDAGEH